MIFQVVQGLAASQTLVAVEVGRKLAKVAVAAVECGGGVVPWPRGHHCQKIGPAAPLPRRQAGNREAESLTCAMAAARALYKRRWLFIR